MPILELVTSRDLDPAAASKAVVEAARSLIEGGNIPRHVAIGRLEDCVKRSDSLFDIWLAGKVLHYIGEDDPRRPMGSPDAWRG